MWDHTPMRDNFMKAGMVLYCKDYCIRIPSWFNEWYLYRAKIWFIMSVLMLVEPKSGRRKVVKFRFKGKNQFVSIKYNYHFLRPTFHSNASLEPLFLSGSKVKLDCCHYAIILFLYNITTKFNEIVNFSCRCIKEGQTPRQPLPGRVQRVLSQFVWWVSESFFCFLGSSWRPSVLETQLGRMISSTVWERKLQSKEEKNHAITYNHKSCH